MAFLVKSELSTVSTLEIVDMITDKDETIVTDIIDESISVMSGYLSKFYDPDAIFAAVDDKRHKTVLKHLKGLVIHELYERRSRAQNEVTTRRYEEAMRWLESLNKGDFYDRTLPARLVDSDTIATESDDIRFGGNTRYSSNY